MFEIEPRNSGTFNATKVKTMDEQYRKDLQLWFELNYSSFV